jgi:hypothetical protein
MLAFRSVLLVLGIHSHNIQENATWNKKETEARQLRQNSGQKEFSQL